MRLPAYLCRNLTGSQQKTLHKGACVHLDPCVVFFVVICSAFYPIEAASRDGDWYKSGRDMVAAVLAREKEPGSFEDAY